MHCIQIDLAGQLGVDVVHCQRQATAAVEESRGALLEVHGQLITAAYLDGLASEVQESLQVGTPVLDAGLHACTGRLQTVCGPT